MKKYLACLCAALVAGSFIPLMALDGEVVAISGKVEFQTKAGEWKALKQGRSGNLRNNDLNGLQVRGDGQARRVRYFLSAR